MRCFVTRSISIAAVAVAVGALSCGDLPPEERIRQAEERTDEQLGDALASRGLEVGHPIFIRIFKEESELEIWLEGGDGFELLRTYPVCYFSGHLGPKLREGDRQSPEGFYFVRPGQLNPNSRYHLAFNIGYPNAYDRRKGRTGSFIMVHGLPNQPDRPVSYYKDEDWTDGCIALGNDDMIEFWFLTEHNTPIEILP